MSLTAPSCWRQSRLLPLADHLPLLDRPFPGLAGYPLRLLPEVFHFGGLLLFPMECSVGIPFIGLLYFKPPLF